MKDEKYFGFIFHPFLLPKIFDKKLDIVFFVLIISV